MFKGKSYKNLPTISQYDRRRGVRTPCPPLRRVFATCHLPPAPNSHAQKASRALPRASDVVPKQQRSSQLPSHRTTTWLVLHFGHLAHWPPTVLCPDPPKPMSTPPRGASMSVFTLRSRMEISEVDDDSDPAPTPKSKVTSTLRVTLPSVGRPRHRTRTGRVLAPRWF